MTWTLDQSVATWLAIAARLKRSPLAYQQVIAADIERDLAGCPGEVEHVVLSFCEDTYFRSIYPAARELGISLPGMPANRSRRALYEGLQSRRPARHAAGPVQINAGTGDGFPKLQNNEVTRE